MVSFKTAVKNGFTKAFDFKGRATRAEYWWWVLFYWIVVLAVMMPGMLLCEIDSDLIMVAIIPMLIVYFVGLFPSLSLLVRRLHDAGHSAWYLLWNLVPYVGGFVIFIATVQDSEPDNKYGPNPNNISVDNQ